MVEPLHPETVVIHDSPNLQDHTLELTVIMSASQAAQRIGQVAGHLNYPKGMLAGQVAIITGSGQGIGAEAARLFANEGARVVVSDIDGRMRRLEVY